MTKFDFKQWIINNKAQNKRALNENYNEGMEWGCCCEWSPGLDLTDDWICVGGWGCKCDGSGPRAKVAKTGGEMDEQENLSEFDLKKWWKGMKKLKKDYVDEEYDMMDEQSSPTAPICAPPMICHAFSRCNAGHQDDGDIKNFITTMWGDPQTFWADLGSPTSIGQHVKDQASGTMFIYKGIQTHNTYNFGSTAPIGVNRCGCNPGCTNPNYVEYDSTATCNNGSCQTLIPDEFSECQNCCCMSHMQAKVANPDGGERVKRMRENMSPTIDAIYKLMQLAEQTRDKEMLKSPYDFGGPSGPSADTPSADNPILSPQSTATNTNTPIIQGPCASSHYPNGIGAPIGGYTPDPSFMIDPVTGMCECDPSDPNNPFGSYSTYGYGNPNPGIPNNTGAPNGTGAC